MNKKINERNCFNIHNIVEIFPLANLNLYLSIFESQRKEKNQMRILLDLKNIAKILKIIGPFRYLFKWKSVHIMCVNQEKNHWILFDFFFRFAYFFSCSLNHCFLFCHSEVKADCVNYISEGYTDENVTKTKVLCVNQIHIHKVHLFFARI